MKTRIENGRWRIVAAVCDRRKATLAAQNVVAAGGFATAAMINATAEIGNATAKTTCAMALTCKFHSRFINTGLQPGVCGRKEPGAASAALTHCGKPLKRLSPSSPCSTGLKPGVNERSRKKCEISRPRVFAVAIGSFRGFFPAFGGLILINGIQGVVYTSNKDSAAWRSLRLGG